MNYLKQRFKEPSTWAGVAAIISTAAQAWATRDPQAIGATVAGVVAVLAPESRPQAPEAAPAPAPAVVRRPTMPSGKQGARRG